VKNLQYSPPLDNRTVHADVTKLASLHYLTRLRSQCFVETHGLGPCSPILNLPPKSIVDSLHMASITSDEGPRISFRRENVFCCRY